MPSLRSLSTVLSFPLHLQRDDDDDDDDESPPVASVVMADAHQSEAATAPAAAASPPSNTNNSAAAATSTGTNTTSTAPSGVRFRAPNSRAEFHSPTSPIGAATPRSLSRRRSSILSYSSIEDLSQSFADEFLHPRANSSGASRAKEDELSHWHSTPLAFAILPALAGLLFHNGSAFVTDALLLGLAAIFLNWSIRLPWDWYYSAQAIRKDVDTDSAILGDDEEDDDGEVLSPQARDTIPEEGGEDVAVETASSIGGSPRPSSRRRKSPSISQKKSPHTPAGLLAQARREDAVASLQRQETLALLATFILPVLAAYLLHVIRAQLTRTSTNLVSDYNLSIFLLAAEIRPTRQVIRLLSARTLHLQRVASSGSASPRGPSETSAASADALAALLARVASLEAALPSSADGTHQRPASAPELAELKRRYDPRLDGLERAVRRYEKRSTTLALAVDARLNSLDARLHDAVSLAAALAQQNVAASSSRKGSSAGVRARVAGVLLAPLRFVAWVALLPWRAAEEAYARFKAILLGPVVVVRREKKGSGAERERRKRSAGVLMGERGGGSGEKELLLEREKSAAAAAAAAAVLNGVTTANGNGTGPMVGANGVHANTAATVNGSGGREKGILRKVVR